MSEIHQATERRSLTAEQARICVTSACVEHLNIVRLFHHDHRCKHNDKLWIILSLKRSRKAESQRQWLIRQTQKLRLFVLEFVPGFVRGKDL